MGKQYILNYILDIGLEDDGFIGICNGVLNNPNISKLIAGYNGVSKETKQKYTDKLKYNRIWDDLVI